MTTRVEAVSMFRGGPRNENHDIRGRDKDHPYPGEPEYFNSSRQITIYSSEYARRRIDNSDLYLTIDNHRTFAVCSINPRKFPIDLVPYVHVELDGEKLVFKNNGYQAWRVVPGKIFRMWMGQSDRFEEKSEQYGYAVVTWSEPPTRTPDEPASIFR